MTIDFTELKAKLNDKLKAFFIFIAQCLTSHSARFHIGNSNHEVLRDQGGRDAFSKDTLFVTQCWSA